MTKNMLMHSPGLKNRLLAKDADIAGKIRGSRGKKNAQKGAGKNAKSQIKKGSTSNASAPAPGVTKRKWLAINQFVRLILKKGALSG